MEGVNVLNTYYEDVISREWHVTTPTIIITCFVFIAFAVMVWGFYHKNMTAKLIGGLFTPLLISFALVAGITNVVIGQIPVYEVVVAEDVPFVQFYNQYEIVEQRNDIYVVKIKTMK